MHGQRDVAHYPRREARRRLLDLCGELVANAEKIDPDAPDDEFAAQLRANREFERALEPRIEAARARVRAADTLSRVRAQSTRSEIRQRDHGRNAPRGRRAPRRRTTRAAPAHGPPSRQSSDDDPDPEPVAALAGLRDAAIRAWAHEQRRLGARRVA